MSIEVSYESLVQIFIPGIRLTKPVRIPGSIAREEPGKEWLDILHISNISQSVSCLLGVAHFVVEFLCSLNVEM